MTPAERTICVAHLSVGFAAGISMVNLRPAPHWWIWWSVAAVYCAGAWLEWRKEKRS